MYILSIKLVDQKLTEHAAEFIEVFRQCGLLVLLSGGFDQACLSAWP